MRSGGAGHGEAGGPNHLATLSFFPVVAVRPIAALNNRSFTHSPQTQPHPQAPAPSTGSWLKDAVSYIKSDDEKAKAA